MRLKKASMIQTLSFALMLSFFATAIVVIIFNNIVQEKRSMTIDMINKEAMVLQAELYGYSDKDEYTYMHKNGSRLESRTEINRKKNDAIAVAKKNIEDNFNDKRYSSQLTLESIDINIIDGPEAKDVAKIKVIVKYKASLKAPFSNEEESSTVFAAKINIPIKETITRTIENPIRVKNL